VTINLRTRRSWNIIQVVTSNIEIVYLLNAFKLVSMLYIPSV